MGRPSRPPDRGSSSAWTPARRVAVGLVLAAALLAAAPPTRDLVWSALFLADTIAGDGPSLYKRLTPLPRVADGVLQSAKGDTVLIALSRPQIRRQVDFAVILGGYHGLDRALRHTLTGAHDAEGHSGQVDLELNRHNRWKFLHGNLHLLPTSATRDELTHFTRRRIENPHINDDGLRQRLTPDERHALEFIENEQPSRFDSLHALAPRSITALIDTFSLYHYTPGIRARLFLLHGDGDVKVPFTESLALGRDLPGAPEPTVIIVSTFEHVNLELDWSSIAVVVRQVIPDLAR